MFQPTVIGYVCPYVWSGPGHSHPAVELIGQLEREQHYHLNWVGISICEMCYVTVLYFLVGVPLWTGLHISYRAPVIP